MEETLLELQAKEGEGGTASDQEAAPPSKSVGGGGKGGGGGFKGRGGEGGGGDGGGDKGGGGRGSPTTILDDPAIRSSLDRYLAHERARLVIELKV